MEVILDKSQRLERYYIQPHSWPTRGISIAEKTLLEALEYLPEAGLIHYNLASYSAVERRTEEAKARLGRAIQLVPKLKGISLEDEDLRNIW